MAIQMRCCHLKHKGETWTLDLGEEAATIRDADGKVRGEYLHEEANEQFLMPSFSESVKQFRALIDGEMWYFDVARPDLKEIKAYLDRAMAAAGPEAVQGVRTRAVRDTLLGIGAIGVGIALSVGSFFHAAQQPGGGGYTITYGIVLVGLILVGKGIYGFRRYGQLQNLSQAGDQTPPKA